MLSPAYDINPSVDKNGLSLNINMDNNDLDIELAKSVGEYFRLNINAMDCIILEVAQSVNQWEVIANEIGISRKEQEIMRGAFKSKV
jgi:serine/threonine-protein kinase HipA